MTRLPATVDDLRGLRCRPLDPRVHGRPVRPVRTRGPGRPDRRGDPPPRPRRHGPRLVAGPLRVHGPRVAGDARRCSRPPAPGRSTSSSWRAATAGSGTCARRSTCSRTTSTPSASWSGSTTSSCCRAASGTGTSWSTRRRAPSRGCASTGAASGRATPPSAPRRATRAARPPFGFRREPRDEARRAGPGPPARGRARLRARGRPPDRPRGRGGDGPAAVHRPGDAHQPALRRPAADGRAGALAPGRRPPPLWEAVQAVRATRRTRDGRPAVVRRALRPDHAALRRTAGGT